MAVSNKKRKAIVRGYPSRSVSDLAYEHGLSSREVKQVLREAGVLKRTPLPALLAIAGLLLVLAAAGAGGYWFINRPSRAALDDVKDNLNVLLVTVDTLRADHLGCYGYQEARTPVIDSLAKEGVRFRRAYSHQPITLPSHATIMTGAHPAYHGVHDNGLFSLPGKAETLAEALQQKGFATGAIISSYVMHRQYGLDQGFDHYDDSLSSRKSSGGAGFVEMKAGKVSDRGLAWIKDHTDHRWMLWLHYFDPHKYYQPPEKFRKITSHPYDGEIAYADHELGRVIRYLEKSGLRDNTLIILTSDHGEGLGQHGEQTHMIFLYNTTTHVPLIFSLPGVLPAGRDTDRVASLMDVAPTVLELLDIKPPGSMQGRSLVELLFSDPPERKEKPVLMETRSPWHQYGWSPLKAIVANGYKYVEAPRPELYNLRDDFNETEDLYEQEKGRARAMARKLSDLRKRYGRDSLSSRSRMEMDKKSQQKLASLGYVFSGGGPAEPMAMAPDPKDRKDSLERINRAHTFYNAGKKDRAINLMEKVVSRNPRNRRAMNRLSIWYISTGRGGKAKELLKKIVEQDPGFVEAWYNLGSVYLDMGKVEEAVKVADSLIERNPRYAKAYNLKGAALARRGKHEPAIANYEKAVELFPTYDEAWFNLGLSCSKKGQLRRSREAFNKALEIIPENRKYQRFARGREKPAETKPNSGGG